MTCIVADIWRKIQTESGSAIDYAYSSSKISSHLWFKTFFSPQRRYIFLCTCMLLKPVMPRATPITFSVRRNWVTDLSTEWVL